MIAQTRISIIQMMMIMVLATVSVDNLFADVSTGSAENATNYYQSLTTTIGFSSPDGIFDTTLDDVASYLGYNGIVGADLQNIPPEALMSPEQLLSSNILQHTDTVIASLGAIPIRPDDILATRFFAPKIMNIHDPESVRKLGWRKLVRLRARPGSAAEKNHIIYGIILFNFFTPPNTTLSSPQDESINTQVMLISDPNDLAAPNGTSGLDTLYWLDYQALSAGGKLSLALNASFDANELPQVNDGVRPYFVPDGCVDCHGMNPHASLVNYLDTDHWFDRLENDFASLKTNGISLIVDAETNDTNALSFKLAFDVIRRFNKEADAEVSYAQPEHDEALASHKWLEVHDVSNGHVLPIDRAIGNEPRWSIQVTNDLETLDALNQYCFRCHGTVDFSVFDREKLREPQILAMVQQRLATNAPILIKMPPDRDLPDNVRSILHNFINQ
jgi:hypothetical protein